MDTMSSPKAGAGMMTMLQGLEHARGQIMSTLIRSEALRAVLVYPEADIAEAKAASTTELTTIDPELAAGLLNKYIFPYHFTPSSDDPQRSYLTFSFREFKPWKNSHLTGLLHFKAHVHKSLIFTEHYQLRSDHIANILQEILHHNQELGLGKLEFLKMNEMTVQPDYSTLSLQYQFWSIRAPL